MLSHYSQFLSARTSPGLIRVSYASIVLTIWAWTRRPSLRDLRLRVPADRPELGVFVDRHSHLGAVRRREHRGAFGGERGNAAAAGSAVEEFSYRASGRPIP